MRVSIDPGAWMVAEALAGSVSARTRMRSCGATRAGRSLLGEAVEKRSE
jgi:hypothetical protein